MRWDTFNMSDAEVSGSLKTLKLEKIRKKGRDQEVESDIRFLERELKVRERKELTY